METPSFLIFLIVIKASVSETVKKNLSSTVGGNITLPDPVMEFGFLSFERKNLAVVDQRGLNIYEKTYKDRILWNKTSGLFTITGLQRSDSGIYTVESKTGREAVTSYKLTVYEPVSAPAVTRVNVGDESCILQCFVEKAEETTLWWYKDEDTVNQSSSALPLPLTVDKQDFNSSYRCVAANPAEEKTLTVNVTAFCSRKNIAEEPEETRQRVIIGIVLTLVLVGIVALAAFIIKKKYVDKTKKMTRQTQDSERTEPDLLYTEVHIREDRLRQAGNSTDSSSAVHHPNLTTVYDKLEVHRMISTDSDNVHNDQAADFTHT